ncbi:MAG: zinc dependent phospholipase C family protein [Synechococcales cyanobacterium M58_A2018_015]|nr:zinc dependent phospholipase C family protein [Synechococcales cyanobacterium M58_A2018_015]
MNTPSHFLMTAALDQALPRVPIVKQAFLLGSVAPDLPLWVLSLGGIAYYHGIRGWELERIADWLFNHLYFYDPIWISLHNALHAPILLLLGIAAVWRTRRNIGSRSRWLFWFLLACLLHSGIDIFTHANDGPLLLFPLNWTLRFYGPISYWDPRYYGNEFQQFELGLNLGLLVYLLLPRLVRLLRPHRRAHRV